MTWVDCTLVAIVVVSVVLGLMRGFVREAFSLGVWAAAFGLALHYAAPLSDLLADHIHTAWLRLAVAFGVLFLATVLVGGLLVFLLVRAVRKSGLGGPDRMLGLGFGLLRGMLVVGILVIAGQMTPLTQSDWWRRSAVIGHMQGWVGWVKNVWPGAGERQT